MSAHEDFESLAALEAIGAVSEDEQAALYAHLDTCAECNEVRDGYQEAATAFALALDPVMPPEEARGAIMGAVMQDDFTERRRRGDTRWWLAIAATVFFALWAWRELAVRAAREHIASRDAEIQTLAEQNSVLTQRNEKLNREMAALANKDTRVIALTGQQVAPSASARVFLEPAKRRAVAFFANIPANPNDKSYQLWIIRADQAQPQSAGVFDASPAGSATLSIENLPVDTEIKAMAVTLEAKGGVPQPTSTNFVVMGKSSG